MATPIRDTKMPSQIKAANGNPPDIVTGVASLQGNTGPALTGALTLTGGTAFSVAGAGSTLTISRATNNEKFGAYQVNAVTNTTGDGTVYTPAAFTTESYDPGSRFAASVFTAATTGYYKFSFTGWFVAGVPAGSTDMSVWITTTSQQYLIWKSDPTVGGLTNTLMAGSAQMQVTSGETVRVQIQISGGAKTAQWSLTNPIRGCNFTGQLIR